MLGLFFIYRKEEHVLRYKTHCQAKNDTLGQVEKKAMRIKVLGV